MPWSHAAKLVVGVITAALVILAVRTPHAYAPHSGVQVPSHQAVAPAPKPKPDPPPYQFPAGGRQIFPKYRLVALYGSPGSPALGVLGQQPAAASIVRVKELAKTYQQYSTEPILPTFEIIATIASASPTSDGDYSTETDPSTLEPWVQAAQEAGVYVVLDLQPGRADFLAQAKEYSPLLLHPNVGLALDPEWKLAPGELPLRQIGTVDTADINRVSAWLAQLVATHKLPQKLLLLHEFQTTMITNRQALDTSSPQLAYAIQMDGQGSQPSKDGTWHTILQQPPANIHFGWKNFYQKDSPVLTPAQTMQLSPKPWYVSYQ